MNKTYKKWMIAVFVMILAGSFGVWHVFTEKFTDTADLKSDYAVNVPDFINEFKTDINQANKKYAEKIIVVSGIVSEVKAAYTTVNIIMKESGGDAYIIFAFQQQHLAEARQLKEGDRIAIKGSCSGALYSEILETESISFKRCTVEK